jgi:hypothetical protein
LQHTPFAQNPVVHSELPRHAAPAAFRTTQRLLVLQKNPEVQSLSAEQLVAQVPALQLR